MPEVKNEKERFQQEALIKVLPLYFHNGVKGLKEGSNLAICGGYILLTLMIYLLMVGILYQVKPLLTIFSIFYGLSATVLGVMLLTLSGRPHGAKDIEDSLKRIGLMNSMGVVPYLIKIERDSLDPRIRYYTFTTEGIPIQKWQDEWEWLCVTLHTNLITIKYKDAKKYIVIKVLIGDFGIPDYIEWNDEFLPSARNTIALGEGQLGPLTVDLTKSPHILIAAQTGGGKTTEVKCIMLQLSQLGHRIYLIDRKGGLDYHMFDNDPNVTLLTEDDEIINTLTDAVDELVKRKEYLREAGFPNIYTYNKYRFEQLQSITIVVDEVSELFDKTGRSSDDKKYIDNLTEKVSTIARLGRAFGIHLILSGQRISADTLSGQIRNNMTTKICGKSDQNLSMLIIDDASASTEIPKDSQGRFMTQDHEVFQGYYIKDEEFPNDE